MAMPTEIFNCSEFWPGGQVMVFWLHFDNDNQVVVISLKGDLVLYWLAIATVTRAQQ